MCGIAGIKTSKILPQLKKTGLENMLQFMFFRGPDTQRYHHDFDISLGHCRLKIIDLSSNADQPLKNEDGTVIVVCNGEIYNFQELRRKLEDCGHSFRSKSDSEVIVHGYEQWGVNVVKELSGMFAFAIWDRKNKRLFLARDRFGMKPLYYSYRQGSFLFASQVKAIVASGLLPKIINPEAIAAYLSIGGVADNMTMYADIYSLPPASYILLEDEQLFLNNYWRPSQAEGIKASDPQEVYSRVRFLLSESVKRHLVSDAPWGIFLSGGVDSASILSLAAKKINNITTISLVFRSKKFDEGLYSRLLAKRFSTNHLELIVTPQDALQALTSAIAAMDEPTFDGINTFLVSQAAKDVGLKVVISGLGGDELFGGYKSFRLIPSLIVMRRLLEKAPSCLQNLLHCVLRNFIPSFPAKEKIVELFDCKPEVVDIYFLLRTLFSERQRGLLLKKKPLYRVKGKEGYCFEDVFSQISWLELNHYMRDILLRDTDNMSMAHSLETRLPFLDHHLVEYVLALPTRYKLDKLNKSLLVKSLGEDLPLEVVRRRKMGFVLPFEEWLRNELKEVLENTFQEKNQLFDEYFDPLQVNKIWQMFLKGQIYWQRPWSIYVLKKWIQYNFS